MAKLCQQQRSECSSAVAEISVLQSHIYTDRLLWGADTSCTVKFVLCIWAILLWGAVGSLCTAPEDHIQIFICAFGWGYWLDINRVHGFDDYGVNWRKNPHRHRENMQTSSFQMAFIIGSESWVTCLQEALLLWSGSCYDCLCSSCLCLFCILSPLPVWSLLSSYFCRWATSNKIIIGISPCWLLFTEV